MVLLISEEYSKNMHVSELKRRALGSDGASLDLQ